MVLQLLNGRDMIIITGASKGIGKYLFDTFLKNRLEVIGTYNATPPENFNSERLSKVDISDYVSVKTWLSDIKNVRNIALINCAGISYNSFAHKADIGKWRRVIEVNLLGTFTVIHCILPLMRNQNYGRIINFSSVVAQLATPGVSAYAASKSALWGLTKSLAAENASKGITVNNINLGYVNIGMGVNDVPPEYQKILKEKLPTKKFCEPVDVYNTVQYLINTEYINGTSIDLNGLLF